MFENRFPFKKNLILKKIAEIRKINTISKFKKLKKRKKLCIVYFMSVFNVRVLKGKKINDFLDMKQQNKLKVKCA